MSEEERSTQAEEADRVSDAGETPTAKMRVQPGNDASEVAEAPAAESWGVGDAPALGVTELEQQLAKEREAATDYMQRWQRAQRATTTLCSLLRQPEPSSTRPQWLCPMVSASWAILSPSLLRPGKE